MNYETRHNFEHKKGQNGKNLLDLNLKLDKGVNPFVPFTYLVSKSQDTKSRQGILQNHW